jgi:hypothetical protein
MGNKRNLQETVDKMVKEELEELNFMGHEYTIEDIKKAAVAAGLSTVLISGLLSQLQQESDEDADMARYEQSDEARAARQWEMDRVNGVEDSFYDRIEECVKRVVSNHLKQYA